MKKLLCLTALAIAVIAPFAAIADDVDDGKACRDGDAELYRMGSETDRGSYCVHAEGVTLLYIGGEAQAEEEGDPDAGNACGAIIVADQNVSGEEDWDNPDPDGDPETNDGTHCD